jgi:mono/diheme cytochrome c family protein
MWGGGDSATPVFAQSGGESLAPYMNDFQRYMHKMALAIDAGNKPLAEFYAAKTRENLGLVEKKFPNWENLQIGALATAMVGAPLKPLEDAIGKGDMAAASTAYDALMNNGCNGCHVATQRPFLKVTRAKANPFNQSFSK